VIPTLHWHGGVIEDGKQAVHLAAKEAAILVALARSTCEGESRDRLIEVVWNNPDLEPDNALGVMNTHAGHLRAKIRPFGLRIISSYRGNKWLRGSLHINWRRDQLLMPMFRFCLPRRPYEELRV